MNNIEHHREGSRLRAGVIGVGSMGRHHARVYAELADVELVGVADRDAARAGEVAERHGAVVLERNVLLDRVDVVSIAVPTPYHYEVARDCIQQGVHVLVEKPFVADPEQGHHLANLATREGVLIQVGHIERFNPAIEVLSDVLADEDIIAIDARRLGPPLDRPLEASVVMDLMIHDVDIALSLTDSDVRVVHAAGTTDGQHATATLEFDDGVIANLSASRVTQQKVRDLSITARNCRVNVDYLDRSVEIHRHSLPEFVEGNGDVQYRHESIVERPTVPSGEPLKLELSSFVEAVAADERPRVGPDQALRALAVTRGIDDRATNAELSTGVATR